MTTRSKRKIVLKSLKKLKTIWHPESTLVYKSKKERLVIGRYVDEEFIPLDEEALELCEEWNMKPDESLYEDDAESHDSEEDAKEEDAKEEDAKEEDAKEEEVKPVSPKKELKSPKATLLTIKEVVDGYNAYSQSFLRELSQWNADQERELAAKQSEYDDLKSKYDVIKKKFDTMKSLFA